MPAIQSTEWWLKCDWNPPFPSPFSRHSATIQSPFSQLKGEISSCVCLWIKYFVDWFFEYIFFEQNLYWDWAQIQNFRTFHLGHSLNIFDRNIIDVCLFWGFSPHSIFFFTYMDAFLVVWPKVPNNRFRATNLICLINRNFKIKDIIDSFSGSPSKFVCNCQYYTFMKNSWFWMAVRPVSYTHLTLPTICSV